MDAKRTEYWPANLVRLVQSCWASSPQERPSFGVILEILKDVLDGKESVPMSLEWQSTNIAVKLDHVCGFSFRRKKKGANTVATKA